jgi:hypothetical protein
MEDIIKQAFEHANYMAVLTNQKHIITEEFNQRLIHYHNGGSFSITKEFLNFLNLLISKELTEDVVLIDDNSTPVLVENLNQFFDTVFSTYFEATNEFYTKHSRLISQRSVEKIVDAND